MRGGSGFRTDCRQPILTNRLPTSRVSGQLSCPPRLPGWLQHAFHHLHWQLPSDLIPVPKPHQKPLTGKSRACLPPTQTHMHSPPPQPHTRARRAQHTPSRNIGTPQKHPPLLSAAPPSRRVSACLSPALSPQPAAQTLGPTPPRCRPQTRPCRWPLHPRARRCCLWWGLLLGGAGGEGGGERGGGVIEEEGEGRGGKGTGVN